MQMTVSGVKDEEFHKQNIEGFLKDSGILILEVFVSDTSISVKVQANFT